MKSEGATALTLSGSLPTTTSRRPELAHCASRARRGAQVEGGRCRPPRAPHTTTGSSGSAPGRGASSWSTTTAASGPIDAQSTSVATCTPRWVDVRHTGRSASAGATTAATPTSTATTRRIDVARPPHHRQHGEAREGDAGDRHREEAAHHPHLVGHRARSPEVQRPSGRGTRRARAPAPSGVRVPG